MPRDDWRKIELASNHEEQRAYIKQRCERVLAIAFRGIHHVPAWHKAVVDIFGVRVTVHDTLSTFDYDVLTRLVVAAHDECVRIEITSAGPRRLRLYLTPRTREGSMVHRHPTMEAAVDQVRHDPDMYAGRL